MISLAGLPVSVRIVGQNCLKWSNEILRFESNYKGQVTGKHYSGVHWDIVESTMLADGSATLTIRYLHITNNKGETITGIGIGT